MAYSYFLRAESQRWDFWDKGTIVPSVGSAGSEDSPRKVSIYLKTTSLDIICEFHYFNVYSFLKYANQMNFMMVLKKAVLVTTFHNE